MEKPHRHLVHLKPFALNPVVFFTICSKNREALLACPEVHKLLRALWERSPKENGWCVGRYVIMPDHVHFFAQAREDASSIMTWVKMLKSVSARQINKSLDRVGSVWQKDYFDRVLRNSENYHQKWNYVFDNPVRAKWVERAEDWPYQGFIHELRVR